RGRVDEDHATAGVNVRGVDRLVRAAQQPRSLAGEPAQHDVGRVNDMPLPLDLAWLGLVRTHVDAFAMRRSRTLGAERTWSTGNDPAHRPNDATYAVRGGSKSRAGREVPAGPRQGLAIRRY